MNNKNSKNQKCFLKTISVKFIENISFELKCQSHENEAVMHSNHYMSSFMPQKQPIRTVITDTK